jgi:hypothetical protein
LNFCLSAEAAEAVDLMLVTTEVAAVAEAAF